MSKTIFRCDFLRSKIRDVCRTKKIIIHRSDSISTSVKLYERHKFLAEELFKMKQARQQNQPVRRSIFDHRSTMLFPLDRHSSAFVQNSH